ncbi:HNH/ENDO VII family nuclease [Fictibacillus enclensis]|uniref:HNH/ENDO VII family nuclease n=1 Tax=Fictibacillus enclensis TaxID=1017270 RepID=UPI0025A03721|nr:HNH/ENDO VII family nuclease [Fictibacillus enclensis]MDM5201101.1 HNH/ENDO VII family nuclease [Fictibacillus enclensis]
MEIKIEPNRLASLSKRMLEHQNRAKNLQHSLERETGKASSILSRSEFPPPFSGQISATNGSIKETSQSIVQTLEYQAAWLSYFAHQATGADNVPLSLTQATAILAKYDDRFRDPGKTDGIDAGKLAKDAAGELSGIYDAQRAATGIDPATGEKISGWGRVMASGMFVFGLTPIGKGVKAFKVMRTADKVIGVAKEGQAATRVVGSADVVKATGKEYKNYKAVEYKGTTRVNGEERDISRRVFQRIDIDYQRIDTKTGKTNLQLMKKGRAPIWKDETAIELHHLIQREPGSMVEIPASMHDEYNKILHGLVENGGSFRNDPALRKQYDNFRSKYWRWRAKQIENGEL